MTSRGGNSTPISSRISARPSSRARTGLPTSAPIPVHLVGARFAATSAEPGFGPTGGAMDLETLSSISQIVGTATIVGGTVFGLIQLWELKKQRRDAVAGEL